MKFCLRRRAILTTMFDDDIAIITQPRKNLTSISVETTRRSRPI